MTGRLIIIVPVCETRTGDSFLYYRTRNKAEGTLINFTGMKRLNARGLAAANKMLLLAATCYNLKKWLKFIAPKTNTKTIAMLWTKARKAFAFMPLLVFRI